MLEERRTYPRKMVSFSTNILETKTKKVLGECILTDISKNGFAIETETNLPIGQNFCLNLEVLYKEVTLIGKIVRTSEGLFYPLYGLKIVDNECINLDFFRKYIDYSLN